MTVTDARTDYDWAGPAAATAAPAETTQGRYNRLVKPVLDKLGALVILVLMTPVFLVAALAVRASLGRGVFYVQERIGQGGRRFRLYKFRTMHRCRREADAPYEGVDRRVVHKHPEDPRLTPTGRLLRRLSLDEIPQLVNVIKGDMSLVGPRPELPAIVNRYEPWQHDRHWVKPGITGLWQVSERDTPMHLATHVDIAYLQKMSLWTDLKILVRTFSAVVRRDGW